MTEATRESWRRLRDLVKRRDNSTCFHCRTVDEDGHCDHLIPLSKGGTDCIFNLVWSCAKCNQSKQNKLIELGVEPDIEHHTIINQYPNLSNIIPSLIRTIIPPVPEYVEGKDFLSYFNYIIAIKKFPLYFWLYQSIWKIPESTGIIIDAANKFIQTENHLKKDVKITDKITCPECGNEVNYEFVKIEKKTYLNWKCSEGHEGTSKSLSLEEAIEVEKKQIAKQAYKKLNLEFPDWLVIY